MRAGMSCAPPRSGCAPSGIDSARRPRGRLLGRDDLAPRVVAAAAAHPVGKHRLLAVRAGDDLHRRAEVAVGGATAVAAHLRRPLLGNSHGVLLLVQLDVLQGCEAGIYLAPGAIALTFVEVLPAGPAEALAVLGADCVHPVSYTHLTLP